jgi:hypothetical protein
VRGEIPVENGGRLGLHHAERNQRLSLRHRSGNTFDARGRRIGGGQDRIYPVGVDRFVRARRARAERRKDKNQKCESHPAIAQQFPHRNGMGRAGHQTAISH